MARRAWPPCRLTARSVEDDLSLTWIRRARRDGDAWTAGEPIHECPAVYRVKVSGGVSARQWDVSEASATYTASDQATDFPAGGDALIEVAQIGANGEPGGWTALELTIPVP